MFWCLKACVCVCVYRIYPCMHMCLFVCVGVLRCVCVCVYTHTHTYTQYYWYFIAFIERIFQFTCEHIGWTLSNYCIILSDKCNNGEAKFLCSSQFPHTSEFQFSFLLNSEQKAVLDSVPCNTLFSNTNVLFHRWTLQFSCCWSVAGR